MHEGIDFSLLTALHEIRSENVEDTVLLKSMAVQAQQFLLSFDWCKEIKQSWLGWGVEGICAVFLFDLLPAKADVDSCLWVVVGDLPSAYLVANDGPASAMEALATYVELMQEWCDAVHRGKPTDDLIPVNAPATPDYASQLEKRLDFIRNNFLA